MKIQNIYNKIVLMDYRVFIHDYPTEYTFRNRLVPVYIVPDKTLYNKYISTYLLNLSESNLSVYINKHDFNLGYLKAFSFDVVFKPMPALEALLYQEQVKYITESNRLKQED